MDPWIQNKIHQQPLCCARAHKMLRLFYTNVIRCERDGETGMPVDPITQEPISKEYIVRIPMVNKEQHAIPLHVPYDIKTLNMWFRERGKNINPLTNTPFTQNQVDMLCSKMSQLKIKPPSFLRPTHIVLPTKTHADIVVKSAKKSIAMKINTYASKSKNILSNSSLATCMSFLFSYSMTPKDYNKFLSVYTKLTPEQQHEAVNYSRLIDPAHPLSGLIARETILFNAIYTGNPMLVLTLLEDGADPFMTDIESGVHVIEIVYIAQHVYKEIIMEDIFLFQNEYNKTHKQSH